MTTFHLKSLVSLFEPRFSGKSGLKFPPQKLVLKFLKDLFMCFTALLLLFLQTAMILFFLHALLILTRGRQVRGGKL